ncbi:MAG TPA: hypothetical protein VGO52_17775 [Hyphomonadaceae bacterium]|nr:hypothetical protein [Hyphomonadaceae bacterium]
MSGKPEQLDVLGEAAPLSLPKGVVYAPEVLSTAEERELADQFAVLDLKPFSFQDSSETRERPRSDGAAISTAAASRRPCRCRIRSCHGARGRLRWQE